MFAEASHTPGPVCPSTVGHSESPPALSASSHSTFAEAPCPAPRLAGRACPAAPGAAPSSLLLPAVWGHGGLPAPRPQRPRPGSAPSWLPYQPPCSGRLSKAAALSFISAPSPVPSCPVPPCSPPGHIPRAHLSLTAFVCWDPALKTYTDRKWKRWALRPPHLPTPNQLPWDPCGLGSPHQCLLRPRAR